MTTALATLNESTGIELTEAQAFIQMEAGNDAGLAFDFQASRVKFPSGGSNFFDLDGEPLKVIEGIVVLSQKARAYWASEGTGSPPLCQSPDGIRGFIDVESDQITDAAAAEVQHPAIGNAADETNYDCRSCPLATFGSAPKGAGQACKALRRLVVLVDGYRMPIMMTLPPTSIKPFDRFASGKANKGSAYFACRVKISLEGKTSSGGVDYSIAKFESMGDVEDVDMLGAIAETRNEFRELIAGLEIQASEYETVDA